MQTFTHLVLGRIMVIPFRRRHSQFNNSPEPSSTLRTLTNESANHLQVIVGYDPDVAREIASVLKAVREEMQRCNDRS